MREYVMIWGLLSLGLGLPPAPIAPGRQVVLADDDQEPSKKNRDQESSLRMSPGIVCRSIDGYEQYEALPGAAQTSDEKLLVYVRIHGFKIEHNQGYYRAHLVPDFEIRQRGEKADPASEEKMFEYKPQQPRSAGRDLHEKRDLAQGTGAWRLQPDPDPAR